MVHISITDLSKRFGKQTVLDHVHLEIAAGELFFLLGPSGCGKTTLLRHIAGFCSPDQGRIFFDDKDVTKLAPHRRGLGMMFQSYALWPHMNVAENVAFGLEERKRPRPEIEQRVAEALRLVKLDGLGARHISQLSGGQQQRVALARALVVRPRCLLLDEPLSNLDAKLRLEMRAEIRHLCREFGLTTIYVTHDRDEALSMADRLGIMEAGRLVQVGTPEDVYRNPFNRLVAEFIGETNLIEGHVKSIFANEGIYDVATAFGVFRARKGDDSWEPAANQAVTLSVRPETLTFGHMLGSPNQFLGHIIETTYLGATAQYLLQIPGGPAIKVLETNPQKIRQPSEEPVRVMASAGDTVMLRA